MLQAVSTLNRKEDNTILVENSKREIIHNIEEELKESLDKLKINKVQVVTK